MNGKDKLIVALDVDNGSRAWELFETLRESAGMFKIGSQLFTAAGPDIVRRIINDGGRVFLDLKFHDIPNTVAAAAVEATRLGVSIFNVHAAGGSQMMKRAADAVAEVALRERLEKPKIIAVTLLTSVDQDQLAQIGINEKTISLVGRLASITNASGLDGVVASPHEIAVIRQAVPRPDFLIVTPGIRSAGEAVDDQRRIMTAAEAVRAGADFVVVGRPVLNASDPVAAAQQLSQEMSAAAAEGAQAA